METVGIVNLFAARLRVTMLVRGLEEMGESPGKAHCFTIPAYPSWYYYAGQGQGESCQEFSEQFSSRIVAQQTLTS